MPNESAVGPSPEFPKARTPAERIAEVLSVRFRTVPWDPPEIVPAAVITAVLLFALGEIVAAIVMGLAAKGFGAAALLLAATSWAQPVLAALLLGSVFLSWTEVRVCCEDLDFFSSSEDDLAAKDIDPTATIARLFRSRFLASSALVAAVTTSAAAIATEVGIAMERLPHPIGASVEQGVLDAQTWGALIEGGGIALAVVVLALASLVIVLRIHRRARATLALSEGELAADEGFVAG